MSIDDWFADRRDGSFGDAPDDEVVEFTPFAELPPEFADEPLSDRDPVDVDALRRRDGLPSRLPGVERRSAAPRPSPAGAEVEWHLRERIVDAARVYDSIDPRVLTTELRRRGADVTSAQVAQVLGTLTASEREHVHGRQTAVQREARQLPAQLGRPLPPRAAAPAREPRPAPRPAPRSVRTPETCPACGVRPRERGLCGCS